MFLAKRTCARIRTGAGRGEDDVVLGVQCRRKPVDLRRWLQLDDGRPEETALGKSHGQGARGFTGPGGERGVRGEGVSRPSGKGREEPGAREGSRAAGPGKGFWDWKRLRP